MTEKAVIEAVAIGGSAGGVQTLLEILPRLPADFPLPVFLVMHVPPDRDHALVSLFEAKCALPVKEAADKEAVAGGTIYIAPADYHVLVEEERCLALSSDELVNHSRPAIDLMMQSAADAYGPGLVGVVLSGANRDGAAGLQAIARAGGIAIVQDPTDAQVATMPEAALAACPDAIVLRREAIAQCLTDMARHD